MDTTNQIIDALRDGQWHYLDAISEEHRLHHDQVLAIIDFLAEYDLVALDEEHMKVKLSIPMLKFLKEIQTIEENEELASQIS